jgi:hypothetical protein
VSGSAALPIELVGEVACLRKPGEAAGLALSGAEACGMRTVVTFGIEDPPGLPPRLEGVTVMELPGSSEPAGSRRFRIVSGSSSWSFDAKSLHVHRDVSEAFFVAVPPRRAPFDRRLFFDLLPMFAGNTLGRKLLRAVRRRRSATRRGPTSGV